MSMLEILRLALINLALHRFRSFLAVLGIILGVASVGVMSSIIEGARQESLRRFDALGMDTMAVVSVKPGKTEIKKTTIAGEHDAGSFQEYGLRRRDLGHLRRVIAGIETAVGFRDMRTSLYGRDRRELDLRVIATEPAYAQISRSVMACGRFLADLDSIEHKRVAVLGHGAVQRLLGFQDPLKSEIRIAGRWYRVVGVLEESPSRAAAGGDDTNQCVFIPLATAKALHGDASTRLQRGGTESVRVELDGILVRVAQTDDVMPAARQIERYLQATHKQTDYRLQVPLEILLQKEAENRTFAIVMTSIACISLVVGGIGIMNIMLANVYDRRKEIGTRRALGARQTDILRQFLFEAATLTVLGGIAGVALGASCIPLVKMYAGWPAVFSGWSATLSVAVSCAVGVIFGLWPAWQAAKVNPINALRAE